MILAFAYQHTAGRGHAPQMVHMMDNGFRIIYLSDSGLVMGKVSHPNMGLYEQLVWKEKGRMSPDENVTYPSLKKVAHYGAYGFWSAKSILPDSIGDHRFVMYMLPTDITQTLLNGSISLSKDSAVSSASFTFQNVKGFLLKRYRSLVAPNAKIELYFSMGDSHEIALGKWFIDRVSTSVPGNDVSVSARNTIGKLLKEQSFDETISFKQPTLSENLKAILAYGGVEDFFVGDPAKNWQISFESQNSLLSGIEDVIGILPGYKIEETYDGTIGIGPYSDTRFEQPSTYYFERDKNCFNYSTEYCDEQTYARICVSCDDPPNTIYTDVPPHKLWPMPAHRTLFVKTPNGATLNELQAYADDLSESVGMTGRTETFAGRFTPQMVIGDEVQMTANGETNSIGIVTSVRHNFGTKGFFTEFTIDSGGRKGKPLLKDYVSQITGNKKSKAVISNQ